MSSETSTHRRKSSKAALGRIDTSLANRSPSTQSADETSSGSALPYGTSPVLRSASRQSLGPGNGNLEEHSYQQDLPVPSNGLWGWPATSSATSSSFGDVVDPLGTIEEASTSSLSARVSSRRSPNLSGRPNSRSPNTSHFSAFPSSRPHSPNPQSSDTYSAGSPSSAAQWVPWASSANGDHAPQRQQNGHPIGLGLASTDSKGRPRNNTFPLSPFSPSFRTGKISRLESVKHYWFTSRKITRYLVYLFFTILCIIGIRHRWPKRAAAPVQLVIPPQIWHGGAGALRDEQQRLTKPESIPYHDLFTINSLVEPNNDLTISILFIPAPETTANQLIDFIEALDDQSIPPLSYHVLPSATFNRFDLPTSVDPSLPSPDDAHYTLILPLSSASHVHFGPTVLQYILHLSGTREFSGALLELGCQQVAFVQTTWLGQLHLGRQNAAGWNTKGISSIRVPLVDKENGLDGFWADGLEECSARTSVPADLLPSVDAAKVRIFVEPDEDGDVQWYGGWKELICEFAGRRESWAPEILVVGGRDPDASDPALWCDSGSAVPKKSVEESSARRQLLQMDHSVDVMIHVSDGIVAHILGQGGLAKELQARMAVIGLPRSDLAHALWLAALSTEALSNWNVPRIDLAILTNNRAASLNRLLTSVQGAHYFGSNVHLGINLEQTRDRQTQQLVDSIHWPHGSMNIRRRIVLAGLMPAVVESWYPRDNHTYGVILEDDVEVSPYFFAWLKFTILHYRYTTKGRAQSQRMFGVSLYQQKNVELRPEGRRDFDAHKLFDALDIPFNTPYLGQVPCSWGAAYFPEIWREYYDYLSIRLSETSIEISDIVVPELKSNRWPRSWKKYFNELVYLRGYAMLYPNYADFESFSTNHLEQGTHIKAAVVDMKRKMQFEVPLMADTDPTLLLELPKSTLPEWPQLPVVDLWGYLATEEDVVTRGWTTMATMATCGEGTEAQLYQLDRPPTYDAQELLCERVFEGALDLSSVEDVEVGLEGNVSAGDVQPSMTLL